MRLVINSVKLLLIIMVMLVLMPVIAIFSAWGDIDTALWQHMASTRLPGLILNTFYLLLLVSLFVTVFGVGLAYWVCFYDFYGRRFFEWALILPMAIPGYVLAFVFLGVFEYAGPVQTQLREWGLHFLTVNDVRHPLSVSLVMSAVLYPYVYLLARNAFLSQSTSYVEAARSLRAKPWRIFIHIRLGMAWPAIAAGLALVVMEALSDFGTVAIFNYDTFTLAIYKAWFDYFNVKLACQIASLLLACVACALFAEHMIRGEKRFSDQASSLQRKCLHGTCSVLAAMLPLIMLLFSFVLPISQLVIWAVEASSSLLNDDFIALLLRSVMLALVSALFVVLVAGLLAWYQYKQRQPKGILITLARLGYALPGTVLAVGLVMALGFIDNSLLSVKSMMGVSGQLLLGTVAALLLAYLIRFLSVGLGPLEASFSRIDRSIPDAAKGLGANAWRRFSSIYLPLISPGLLLAMLLVFVDVMKEMPASLLMRPFGWNTLAIKIYEYTSEGEYQLAALPALCLLVVGIIPIVMTIAKKQGL